MIQVSEYVWRGPRPGSVAELLALGFERIIDLQSGFQNRFFDDLYEMEAANAHRFGMEIVKIHCSNIFPPTDEQVALATVLLNDPIKTYVHCHSGVDRTGFVIAAYEMNYLGKSFKEAHKNWVQKGRHWWFFWWKYALKRWAR